MLIGDLTAICDREVLPLRTGPFNSRTAMSRVIQERGLCVLTVKNRVPDVVTIKETEMTFRCAGCGYRWSAK